MKTKFIKDTKNITAMIAAMSLLKESNKDLPGLGLICGKAGLGKTRAVRWYATQYNEPYLRAIAAWSLRSMLHDIATELGIEPEGTNVNVFRQIKNDLISTPRIIFIDEADYLTRSNNWRLLETLRDLHDMSGSSFVFVGMGGIQGKLRRKHQLWSRVSQIVEFQPLSSKEISFLGAELAGLEIPEKVAIHLYAETTGDFRDVMVALSHLERMARANSRTDVNKDMVALTSKTVLKKAA